MQRYGNTTASDTEYETRLFPVPSDTYAIRTDRRYRLDRLAYDQLQDSKLWWVIKAANPEIEGQTVEAGTRVRIPSNLSAYRSEIRRTNDD